MTDILWHKSSTNETQIWCRLQLNRSPEMGSSPSESTI